MRDMARNTRLYGISVVTEVCVTDPGVAKLLENWLSILKDSLSSPRRTSPFRPNLATTDLFLEIDRKLQLLVRRPPDHAHHTVSWPHDLDTDNRVQDIQIVIQIIIVVSLMWSSPCQVS